MRAKTFKGGIHPKEYKKAINRGATFYEEDMALLKNKYKELEGGNVSNEQ